MLIRKDLQKMGGLIYHLPFKLALGSKEHQKEVFYGFSSKQYILQSHDPTYTLPSATVGEEHT